MRGSGAPRRPGAGIAILGAAGVLALSAPVDARADLRIDGRGWGHGVGLSQWGARGYASVEHRRFRWILGHYYPGTTVGAGPAVRMRVRLEQRRVVRLSEATRATGSGGRRVVLRRSAAYRAVLTRDGNVRLIDTASGRTRATLGSPVRIEGPSPVRLEGTAENGVLDGRYRGELLLGPAAEPDELLVVDRVSLEAYLRGVVPAEMPTSWPAQALAAQAVVARSYAVTGRRPAEPFDVDADTRSQMYRGVAAEAPATDAAVRATRGLVVRFAGGIARTFFHASSGGRTAPVEDAFGSAAMPYLVSVEDPYDRLSPFHRWTVTLSATEARQRLQPVLAGDLLGVEVTERTTTGRARTVRITGTGGASEIDGATARRLLGLRSTWFTAAMVPAPASRAARGRSS